MIYPSLNMKDSIISRVSQLWEQRKDLESTSEPSQTFLALSVVHILISVGITYYHLRYVPELVQAFKHGTISPELSRWLLDFAQFLGDNENGFFAMLALAGLDSVIAASELVFVKLKKVLAEIRRILPVIAIPLIMLAIIDVETLQLHSPYLLDFFEMLGLNRKVLYPWIQGTPNMGDIFAGLYGLVAGTSLYELCRIYVANKIEASSSQKARLALEVAQS